MPINKNKKGFAIIWSLGIIMMVAVLINGYVSGNKSNFFWNKSLITEEQMYSHVLTIESWAKKRISKHKGSRFFIENSKINNVIMSGDTELEISVSMGVLDGGFNIDTLRRMSTSQEKIVSELFRAIFPKQDYKKMDLCDEGICKNTEKLEYSDFFYEKKLRAPIDSVIPENAMVNFNLLPDLLRQNLEVYLKKNILPEMIIRSESEMENTVGQLLAQIFKTTSLYYYLKGHIIIDGFERELYIEFEKNGNNVKTTQRKIK